MFSLNIQPLHKSFGVSATGIDLSGDLADEFVNQIWGLIDEYSFVVFPGQDGFNDDKQLGFTRLLGSPEPSHVAKGEEGKLEYFGTIGNVQPDGTALGNEHRKTKFLTGNNLWHSDASFKPVPAALSVMCAYETPEEGGQTLFASTRSAYAQLDADLKSKLDPMVGIHDYTFSRSKVSPDAVSPSLSASLPPVRQKLVRTNPTNKLKNLFIGSHVREIEGMGFDESRALLDQLVEHSVREENIVTHAWQPGDLVIWDNRCLIHRGAGYDADKYRRLMRQTRVAGTASSLEE
jgi:alpha-ketoglutarate-dependent 2,4-dichlorophenoxyacetate dioxygenase